MLVSIKMLSNFFVINEQFYEEINVDDNVLLKLVSPNSTPNQNQQNNRTLYSSIKSKVFYSGRVFGGCLIVCSHGWNSWAAVAARVAFSSRVISRRINGESRGKSNSCYFHLDVNRYGAFLSFATSSACFFVIKITKTQLKISSGRVADNETSQWWSWVRIYVCLVFFPKAGKIILSQRVQRRRQTLRPLSRSHGFESTHCFTLLTVENNNQKEFFALTNI